MQQNSIFVNVLGNETAQGGGSGKNSKLVGLWESKSGSGQHCKVRALGITGSDYFVFCFEKNEKQEDVVKVQVLGSLAKELAKENNIKLFSLAKKGKDVYGNKLYQSYCNIGKSSLLWKKLVQFFGKVNEMVDITEDSYIKEHFILDRKTFSDENVQKMQKEQAQAQEQTVVNG